MFCRFCFEARRYQYRKSCRRFPRQLDGRLQPYGQRDKTWGAEFQSARQIFRGKDLFAQALHERNRFLGRGRRAKIGPSRLARFKGNPYAGTTGPTGSIASLEVSIAECIEPIDTRRKYPELETPVRFGSGKIIAYVNAAVFPFGEHPHRNPTRPTQFPSLDAAHNTRPTAINPPASSAGSGTA